MQRKKEQEEREQKKWEERVQMENIKKENVKWRPVDKQDADYMKRQAQKNAKDNERLKKKQEKEEIYREDEAMMERTSGIKKAVAST